MATEEEARAAKRRHSVLLLQQPGVSGVGVERDSEGSYFIAIHLDQTDPEAGKDVPSQLDGCPTRLVHSGPFRKLSGR
jgi:hypothetical protein